MFRNFLLFLTFLLFIFNHVCLEFLFWFFFFFLGTLFVSSIQLLQKNSSFLFWQHLERKPENKSWKFNCQRGQVVCFCVVPSIHSAVTFDYCSPYELAPTLKIQIYSCQFQQDFLVLSANSCQRWWMDHFSPQEGVFVCGRKKKKRKKSMEMRGGKKMKKRRRQEKMNPL